VHYHEYDNCFSMSRLMHVHDGYLLSENVNSNLLYIRLTCCVDECDYKTSVDLSGFMSASEYNLYMTCNKLHYTLGFTESRYQNAGVYDI